MLDTVGIVVLFSNRVESVVALSVSALMYVPDETDVDVLEFTLASYVSSVLMLASVVLMTPTPPTVVDGTVVELRIRVLLSACS